MGGEKGEENVHESRVVMRLECGKDVFQRQDSYKFYLRNAGRWCERVVSGASSVQMRRENRQKDGGPDCSLVRLEAPVVDGDTRRCDERVGTDAFVLRTASGEHTIRHHIRIDRS